jgi:hypothetical protein
MQMTEINYFLVTIIEGINPSAAIEKSIYTYF